MIQKTRWYPDTCDCIVEYEWDDVLPQENRVHTISRMVRVCTAHQGKTKEKNFEEVLDENQSKNKALGLLVSLDPKFEGKHDEFSISFNEDREVVISHPLLTQKNKDDFDASPKDGIKKVVRFA